MNIIFFGSSKFVIPIIEVLYKNFDLKLVLTTEKPKLASQVFDSEVFDSEIVTQIRGTRGAQTRRGETLQETPVIAYCIENKIPYLSVSSLSDQSLISHLSSLNSPVGVLADFGLIIPKRILEIFPYGIINIHPSLLPKYRGPTPVQTAILNGDKITGVSIIKLDEEVDHGPILAQSKGNILPTDTAESLYQRLFQLGASLIIQIIRLYLEGEIKLREQEHSKATFTKPLTRQDGYIDISKIKDQRSKTRIERMVRAYYPWPGVWTKFRIQNSEFRIKFLPDKKLQVEGKKPVSIRDFINGYPEAKDWINQIF